MLNDLNKMIADSTFESDYLTELTSTSEIENSDLKSHPSYQKGYDMAMEGERRASPYTINSKDAKHLKAFALGFNHGLQDSE